MNKVINQNKEKKGKISSLHNISADSEECFNYLTREISNCNPALWFDLCRKLLKKNENNLRK